MSRSVVFYCLSHFGLWYLKLKKSTNNQSTRILSNHCSDKTSISFMFECIVTAVSKKLPRASYNTRCTLCRPLWSRAVMTSLILSSFPLLRYIKNQKYNTAAAGWKEFKSLSSYVNNQLHTNNLDAQRIIKCYALTVFPLFFLLLYSPMSHNAAVQNLNCLHKKPPAVKVRQK